MIFMYFCKIVIPRSEGLPLNTIETLICHAKIEFNRVCFLRFCTKYDT